MNNEDKIIELLGTLINKMDRFEQGQSRLEQGQERLEQRQEKLEVEVSGIKNHLITMERTNRKIFKGLFSGYEDLYEKSGEIRSKLTNMENAQKKIDVQELREELGIEEPEPEKKSS